MLSVSALLFLLALVGASCGSPGVDNFVKIHSRSNLDIFNTHQLIERLVEDLHYSAKQAFEAAGNFSAEITNQVKLYTEQIETNIRICRERVANAVKTITDELTNVTANVRNCIDTYGKQADDLLNEALNKSKSCGDERIKQISDMINDHVALSASAIENANNALDNMKTCTEDNSGNILSMGLCLGPVALQAESKGAVFMAQSGISLARINLSIGMLPVKLEICAGSSVIEAGLYTARIVMEIGNCSATSIVSSFNSSITEIWKQ